MTRKLITLFLFVLCYIVGEHAGAIVMVKDIKDKCTVANAKYKDFNPDKDSDEKYTDAAMWEQACVEALEELREKVTQ